MNIARSFYSIAAICAMFGANAAQASPNLVTNGDFSLGNVDFTSGYPLTTMTPHLFQDNINGLYAVIPIGSVAGQSAYGDWTNVTTDPSGGNGNVFVADGEPISGVIAWSQTVTVTPDTDYTFSFYGAEISNACCSNAVLVPAFDGTTYSALDAVGSWAQDSVVWNSGSDTSVTLSITDSNTSGPYNDFVLTDIALVGPAAAAVPEPATWALMIAGFSMVGFSLRRRPKVALTAA